MGYAIYIFYAICVVFLFLYSFGLIHLLTHFFRNKSLLTQKVPPLTEVQLPFITVQLPVYNELYVIERLMEAVAKQDYPKNKFLIQILDDSTDETVEIIQQKIQFLEKEGFNVQYLHRINRQGFKAGALAEAMDKVQGDFIAIFDADFEPRPDFLRKMIAHFTDEKIGMVQTRWEHLNQSYSLFTEAQAFHLDVHFMVEQFSRCHAGYFMNFNGTAGIWRKQAILEGGGWETDTLTEDLDLSYRVQLAGWKMKYVDEVGAPAELPILMSAIKSQQFRWMKGGAEVARKVLGKVFASNVPFLQKYHAVQHLLSSSIFILSFFLGILSIPLFLYAKIFPIPFGTYLQYANYLVINLLILTSFYAIAIIIREKNCLKGLVRMFKIFLPFLLFMMGLSLHNARAAFLGLIGKKSPFIRTPKFNIVENTETWKKNKYRQQKIPKLIWAELLLSLYFFCGILLSIHYQDFILAPFFILMFLGYLIVGFFSLTHALK
jgi:cellulose synthase/poly-beta-1,6-N-acetylglucosamine synthase-like glycosyltransferase